MSKRMRYLNDIARQVGASVIHTRGGHVVIVGPGWKVFTSVTLSDNRANKNLLTHIRYATQIIQQGKIS